MRAEYFEVTESGQRVFINLSLVFRVWVDAGMVTFFFLNNPEQSASYRLTADRIAQLIIRLGQQ